METSYFFGSNTPNGFYGANQDILNDRIIILKGGAGTGKSTLMKKVSEIVVESGYQCELYHCSSDADSLDAIYIPTLKIAVVDGTFPHVIEAEYPAVKHYLVNLAEKMDTLKLSDKTKQIEKCVLHKKQYFTNAYCYLNCANKIMNNIEKYIYFDINKKEIDNTATNIIDCLDNINIGCTYKKKFCTALTNKGLLDFYDSNFYADNVIYLNNTIELPCRMVLDKIAESLKVKNIEYTTFINPLSPDRLEGLKINDTVISYRYERDYKVEINLSLSALSRHYIDCDFTLYKDLINRAIRNVDFAKKTHMEVEKFYYDAMDWEDVNIKTEKIINIIFNC